MDAGPIVYVERLTEPYSGLPLVGVGGYLPGGTGPVEVRYDDAPAAVLTPTLLPDGRRHFATQLPTEPGVERLSVVSENAVLWSGRFDEIGARVEPVAAATGGFVARTARSVLSGEVFSPTRWLARFDRFRTFLLRIRQKVRYKLLMRRHRPRSVHDAYIESERIPPPVPFRHRPTISILVPIYNVAPRWLDAAIQSVRTQTYDNWELCLADDASTDPALRKYLDALPADPRIKLVRRPANGHICAATNAAADLATGEFVALLDHDDALAPHALAEVVALLQSHPTADLIYSDEDKIDAANRRYDPQFKPDWSPELLLSYNYVNHFTVVRRSLFERVGRFRVGYEGSQDHDLLLRVTEKTDRVHHIPKILYHWRALPSSTATAAGVKTYVHTAGRRAVEDALKRRGIVAGLSVPPFADRLGLPILQMDGPTAGRSVAVIVYGSAADASATVRALKETTTYDRVTHFLVLDPADPADALNRIAAARTEDVLVFLRAGIRPAAPDWLARLLAYLSLADVAAAGGLVRGSSGEVVSAGTVLGMNDGIAPASACHGLPADAISYYFYAEVARTVSCPAAGVLATTRTAFERVGGFDTDRFGRTLFDVDYCLRLAGAGYRSVHVGGAAFVTDDVADRASDPVELLALKHAYGRGDDPYYNPNLSDRHTFRPVGESAAFRGAKGDSTLRAVVAAHNLNSPEGAPRYLSEIVVGLRDRGRLAPAVWSPLGGAGEAVYRAVGIGVTVADQDWSRRFVDGQWQPREYEAAQRHLLHHLRGQRPEVVVANTLLTFPVVEAAARLGIPAVWIIHESYSREHLARLFPPFARHRIEAAFALAARVVPASHDTAALFAHLDTRGNVRVLHNGLNAEPFDRYCRRISRADAVARVGGSPTKKRLVAVGTVCERKGQHTLVEAAAILARTRDDFEIDLVGVRDVIPYAGYVRQLVRRRGLESGVRLITETDDAWAYYRSADGFVCTSHMETFSRAILEAEAFGLPIISTACCGVSEQVFWGFNALQFDAGDAAGLADQLNRLLSDDRLRTDMARRSRAAFDNHLTEAEMLDRYDAVIRSAAGRATPSVDVPVPVRRAA